MKLNFQVSKNFIGFSLIIDLLKGLRNYLDNTAKEQFEKDWTELEKYNNVGPTIGGRYNK